MKSLLSRLSPIIGDVVSRSQLYVGCMFKYTNDVEISIIAVQENNIQYSVAENIPGYQTVLISNTPIIYMGYREPSEREVEIATTYKQILINLDIIDQ